jgi:hypothetical protein
MRFETLDFLRDYPKAIDVRVAFIAEKIYDCEIEVSYLEGGTVDPIVIEILKLLPDHDSINIEILCNTLLLTSAQ